MKVEYAGTTNVGLKRSHNEDAYLLAPEQNLFMVADGMGGHNAGEIASQMAVETVARFFSDTADDADVTWPFKMDRSFSYEENRLATSIKLANLRIHESAATNSDRKGMGTTLVSLHIVRDGIIGGHVGDSRIYRIRTGSIEQLTEDHSLLNDYIKMKDLSEEEIENFPHKNVIVRALGMKDTVQVDIVSDSPRASDVYVLCTDGLCGMVTDAQILNIVSNCERLDEACERLIDTANEAGGVDNITACLLRFASV